MKLTRNVCAFDIFSVICAGFFVMAAKKYFQFSQELTSAIIRYKKERMSEFKITKNILWVNWG